MITTTSTTTAGSMTTNLPVAGAGASGKVDYTDEEMKALQRKFEDAIDDPQILVAMRQSASVIGGGGVILAQLKKLAQIEGLLFHSTTHNTKFKSRYILYHPL